MVSQVHTAGLSCCVHWGAGAGRRPWIGPGSGLCQAALPALTYLLSVAGGYGPPPAGRGAPPPPPPFTSYIVSTPPGGFPPPQGFPQGYGAPPQFSECYPSRTEAACQLSAILLGCQWPPSFCPCPPGLAEFMVGSGCCVQAGPVVSRDKADSVW